MKDTSYPFKKILSYSFMVIGTIVVVVSILIIFIVLGSVPDPYARGALTTSVFLLIPLIGGFLAGGVMALLGYFLKPTKMTNIDTIQQK